MGVGLSGMISGLDTDSIVKAMVSGQQAKATKVENKITLNKWTKEAWSGLNTKIYSFYTKYASKLRLQSSYLTRTASSSNESKATAKASSGAAAGTHSLKVHSLASSQYVTGGQLQKNGKTANYSNSTKLKELGVEEGTIITLDSKKDARLVVDKDTTIGDFLASCKEAGLTASFDTKQQRFFISSSDSGEESAFSITAEKFETGEVFSKLDDIEAMVDTSFLSSEDKKSYNQAMSTLRENADLIFDVLDYRKYNSSDKTHKAVYNAIETVKSMAEKTYADQTAKEKELEDIRGLLNPNSSEKIKYGNATSSYDYNSLKKAAETALNSQFTESAQEAMQGINYFDPTKLTKQKITDAYDLLEQKLENTKFTDLTTFSSLTDKDIDELEDNNGNKIQLSNEETKQLKEALAIARTCESKVEKVEVEENGVTITKELTVLDKFNTVYDTAYDTAYKVVYDVAYDAAIADNKGVDEAIAIAEAEAEAKMADFVTEADAIAQGVLKGINYFDSTELTKDKITNAYELLQDKFQNPDKTSFSDLTDSDVDALNLSYDISESLKEALAIARTCESEIDGVTVASMFEDAYDNAVDEAKDEISEKMVDLLVQEQKETFDSNVAEEKKTILNDKNYNENIKNKKVEITNAFISAVSTGNDTNVDANGILNVVGRTEVTTKEYTGDDNPLLSLGLGTISGTKEEAGTTANGMTIVAASNAEFTLDGAKMTETSNNFTVAGLTLNLTGTTSENEEIKITVGKDTDSAYKLIKEALTEYNKLIEEMNTLYNANSARGYDPLTDEQKEAMTETDIENWEKKIKDSLLRRDDTLGTLLSSMRNALSTTYTDDDGKVYSLSTFGIVTGSYTEKGKLHIYGDEDDPTYATYADRLKAALEEDSDKVMEVMTEVFGNLYETMTEKCAKTEISSALTFYNDKQYNNLLKDYEDDLDILEDRIKELEDRYYKQFTAMEKAMSTLQNQSNSLASLLGTGA